MLREGWGLTPRCNGYAAPGTPPQALAFIAGLHPMKRMAAAEEIAEAALFLLSDRSSFVTGSAMLADGGISVRLA